MSVPNQTPIVETVANGNTVTFPYNFYVIKSEDLDVYVGGVMKTEGTDYTVTGIGTSQGGNVTFNAAAKPANGSRVTLRRQTPVERTTNYTYLGDLQASDLNADLDRIWLSLQEQRATFGSSISRPAGGVGNWDAQNFAISQLADATQPQDAVTFKQLTTVNGNATDAANRAAASAGSAAASEQNAEGSASAASASAGQASGSAGTATTKATEASNSATSAYKWAVNPVDTEVTSGNFSALHWATKANGSASSAAGSAQAASASAGQASGSASNAAQQADRAKTEADKLANNNAIAGAISSVDTGTNAVAWKGKLTVGASATADNDVPTYKQLLDGLNTKNRLQQSDTDTRLLDPTTKRYFFIGHKTNNDDWGVWDTDTSKKVALPVASGGTGGLTPATARSSLGVSYGTSAGSVAQGNDSRLNTVADKTGGKLALGNSVTVASNYGNPNVGDFLTGQAFRSVLSGRGPNADPDGSVFSLTAGEQVGTSGYGLLSYSGFGQTRYWNFYQNGNASAGGSWVNGSDERHKTNITAVPDALRAVMSWRGATYNKLDGDPEVGLIAQDVEKDCPVAVFTTGRREFSNGLVIEDFKSLNTGGVSAAYMTEAFKKVVLLLDDMLNNPSVAAEEIKALKVAMR